MFVRSDFFLTSAGPLSAALQAREIERFSQAVAWVHSLPYGRNRDRANYRLLLEEEQGTCSTKHAFLAALCLENQISAQLMVAICLFDRQNAPTIAPLLDRVQICAFPEAHCYLRYGEVALDVTFPDSLPVLQPTVVQEWAIQPHQIGEHKLELHRNWLKIWLQEKQIPLSLDEVWQLREHWIFSITHEN